MPKRKPAHRKSRQNFAPSQFGLGIAVLAFLVGLVVVGKFLTFLGDLGRPLSPDGSAASGGKVVWEGQSRLNLVVKSDSIYLFSFNPQDKTLITVKIPEQLYVNVPYDFGRWPYASIYGLGQAENPPLGAQLLKLATGSVFGLPTMGYLLTPGKDSFESEIEQIRRNPWALFLLMKESRTDLSLKEVMMLWWKIGRVRFDKIEFADLEQSSLTESTLLPDKTRALVLDPLKLDQFVQDKFEDKLLSDAGLGVGIYNTTDHPQLAEKAARLITNIGGRVIFTANSSLHREKSAVLGEESYTKNYLARVFAPECLEKGSSCGTAGSGAELARADVTILLGEDYFLRYNRR